MSGPTPAGVRGGRVVVVKHRHTSWTSELLTTGEAEARAARVAEQVAECADSPALFRFGCADGRVADIRGRDVVSIEQQRAASAPLQVPVDTRTADEIADAVVRP